MRADLPPVESDFTAKAASAAPFACEYVTLTKQEHIALKMKAQHWKTLHARAEARHQWRAQRYARILREFKEQACLAQAKFALAIEEQKAKVRDLQKRLFGGKSERHKGCELRHQGDVSRAHRGQRRGARGHGRTMQGDLPVRHEDVGLTQAHCSHCGLAFRLFPGTEDSEVLEIEVKAYRRAVHRRRYQAGCQCCSLPGIITAPAPPKLIARGKYGITVWVTALLDKFQYGRPSHRQLQDFADHGLRMSPAIGELYRLNGLRLQAPLASAERIDAQAALELAVQEMAARRDAALAQEACPVFWSARS